MNFQDHVRVSAGIALALVLLFPHPPAVLALESTNTARAHLDTVLDFSLSSPEGGEGRGEEADGFSSSNPLTPTLSPLGRGEGVRTVPR
jgi:hypothetical protein